MNLLNMLMNRLETTWVGDRIALMRIHLEAHEKRCAQEQEAFSEQTNAGLREFRTRKNELYAQLNALRDEERTFCDRQDEAVLDMRARQDKERERILQEWSTGTALDGTAQLDFVVAAALNSADNNEPVQSIILLPSSQQTPNRDVSPPQAAANTSSAPAAQAAEDSSSSSSSLPPKEKEEEEEEYAPVQSVGLAYDCEDRPTPLKRTRETYLQTFPGAEPLEHEVEEERSVELVGEDNEEVEKELDRRFVNDNDKEESNYDEEEEEEEDISSDSSSDDQGLRRMAIVDVDDDEDFVPPSQKDEIIDIVSSSSSSSSPKKKKKNGRVLVMEPQRVQPVRQARENAKPSLRRLFDREIAGLIDTLGENSPKTKQNFADIEKVISDRGWVGEWDSFDVPVKRTCNFCAKEANCGYRISIGNTMYHCGTHCIWSVGPLIELLEVVYRRRHTEQAESRARELVSSAQEGAEEKRRHWGRNEDDAHNDKYGIDITKKKKKKKQKKRQRK